MFISTARHLTGGTHPAAPRACRLSCLAAQRSTRAITSEWLGLPLGEDDDQVGCQLLPEPCCCCCLHSLYRLRQKSLQYVILIVHFASVNVSTQPALVLNRLECKCVCLSMYFCFPPQRQTIPPKHSCSSLQHRKEQTKCADQYECVNYCYAILQIEAARSAQLCANTAHFALILPRAAISLILGITAYYSCIQLMAVEFHAVSFCICLFLYLLFSFFSAPVDHFTLKVDWVRKDIHVRSSSPCCLYSRSLSFALASHMSCRGQCLGGVVCLGMAAKFNCFKDVLPAP